MDVTKTNVITDNNTNISFGGRLILYGKLRLKTRTQDVPALGTARFTKKNVAHDCGLRIPSQHILSMNPGKKIKWSNKRHRTLTESLRAMTRSVVVADGGIPTNASTPRMAFSRVQNAVDSRILYPIIIIQSKYPGREYEWKLPYSCMCHSRN